VTLLQLPIGKMLQNLSLGEMMHNANINGIKDINQVLQKLSGKKERMMSFLQLLAKKAQNNGRK
jgi:hypothetical protein